MNNKVPVPPTFQMREPAKGLSIRFFKKYKDQN